MSKGCILLDLDGTILNTNELVMKSLKYTIKTCLGIEKDSGELYKYFGQPLVKIMADLDPDQAEKMVQVYRDYSAERHDKLVSVFPGVRETLVELRKREVPVAVVTSKIKRLAHRGLKLFKLDGLINACIAFEDTDSHKPDPAPILKALKVLGIKDSGTNTIMVGDSPYDILCARNANVKSAAVQWTVHSKEELESLCPHVWLNEFPQLLNYV